MTKLEARSAEQRGALLNSPRRNAWAVVLAGGDGVRLQELTHSISGDPRPKQFCNFFGEKSLLAHTRERIAPLFDEDRILFVLARAHAAYHRQEFSETEAGRNLVQPSNRGTAVAMALCLHRIIQQDEDALVAFFPSDHHYSDAAAFRSSVEAGLTQAGDYPNYVLMLGAEAKYPEVEYGWIQPGRTLVDSLANPLQRVHRFWEKPDARRATLLKKRGCLWNTFVTIGLASAFLELLQATAPRLLRAVGNHSTDHELDRLYARIASVDFSKDVLARVPERLLVLRDAASGWTDFGNPGRVIDVLSRHEVRPSWLSPDRVAALGARQLVAAV